MANPTYTLISTQTVGAGGSTFVTFSSISQTYTDLLIKISARTVATSSMPNIYMTFNSISSGYSTRYLMGTGSAVSSATAGSTSSIQVGVADGSSQTANTFGNAELYIPNYTSANFKSVSSDSVAENNATAGNQNLTASLWSNTAAINTILFFGDANFDQYSTFSLYGIKNS